MRQIEENLIAGCNADNIAIGIKRKRRPVKRRIKIKKVAIKYRKKKKDAVPKNICERN